MIRILVSDQKVLVSSEKGITYEAEINDAWVCLLEELKENREISLEDDRMKGASE